MSSTPPDPRAALSAAVKEMLAQPTEAAALRVALVALARVLRPSATSERVILKIRAALDSGSDIVVEAELACAYTIMRVLAREPQHEMDPSLAVALITGKV